MSAASPPLGVRTLRVLGGLDLRGADGRPVAGVLARPKALGVLVHLALAEGGRRRRRDALLALFWPESDEARARAALRQTLYQLRLGLGRDVVQGYGDQDLGLAEGALWCDAAAFEERIALGDAAGATALYAGELLPGFHVDGAPDFGDWLDRARRRLAAAAAAAERDVAARAPRALAAAPESRRVLVAVLENATGDAQLDPIGRLAADRLAQGLMRLAGVEVVPATSATSASRHARGPAAGAAGPERLRVLAEEADAGIVVGGTYYADGDAVLVQAWAWDAASGRVLHALGPARAPAAAPLPALDALCEQATTALALALESRVVHVRAAGSAASFAAHGAYVEGQARFLDGDWGGALEHLERAAAADPSHPMPVLVSAIAHWNLGALPRADAAVRQAETLVTRMTPFERGVLDMVRAWLRGDWGAAYDAVRRQAALAPGTIASFGMAEEARRRGRPREAVQILESLDPTRGELRGFAFYWVELAAALHALGDHARELDVARRARALHPEEPATRLLEVHALAALGDVVALRAPLEAALSDPGRRAPRAGVVLRAAALELRAHARAPGEADALLREAVAWYEALPEAERAAPEVARAAARARYDVGDLDAAAALFGTLAGERVAVGRTGAFHHEHLQAHLDHGYLGVIALRRGDAAGAAAAAALLAHADGPYLFGAPDFWRAAMAATGGDADGALRHLRRAFANGLPHEPFVHADPHLAPLRGDPRLATLLAARG